ncbi:putative disease resistance RPP13-like protein 1 [Vicia villosa]|uniref:putative disease resistance RPP13-like protein 1 n=1 Tax=Vicia villosa TaxID=3911 RepID=UPI00273BEC85|nr:putative disease resistance RPP13-like protein 1 [Vicia villosa]XP_058758779.1 putative disease resistance RPP13-like protein 1 [Vicia villosa]XP_058758781.1 putative disease resistance RPP13-like protein 1 [Vicia villosa]
MEAIQRETLVSLSNSVKKLLEKIVSNQLVDTFRIKNVNASLSKTVKETLVDLQDVLYYAKYNLIPTQANNKLLDLLRRDVLQVSNLLHQTNLLRYATVLTAKHLKIHSRLTFFIELIKSRTVNLIQILQGLSKQIGYESAIYGRDSDIQKLKHLLLSSDSKIRVISIVGMGGVGKTALAKHLYNLPQVNHKFESRVWIDFSTDVDDLSVFENIPQSITSQTTIDDTADMNTVYPNFLLVLDGVWGATSVNWTLLMDIFNLGETGSRIIVTSRDERVALSMQTFLSLHHMTPLKVEDCCSLLAQHAFAAHNYHQRSNLEEIGRKIARKCDGLPLAAVAHGALLRIWSDPYAWNYVLESKAQDIAYEVQASLELSYNFLSDPLKRCFQFCSIFPKKSILEKKMVVQLWIVAGLLESSSTDQEKVGEEYFDELVSRSLIHRRSISDEEGNFGMHNLIHDLATEVISPEVSSPHCINMDKYNLDYTMHNFSYNRGTYDSYDKFDKLYGLEGLRTFLAFPLQEQLPLCLLSNKIVHDLLPKMKQLRMLSLSSYKSITEVPNSIGNLLYMQYLNLSHTNIERLPSETCKLYHLQFLLLAGCKRLTELPEDMGKLINLRHLDISNTALREMPVQIAKLENLHNLSDFVVSKQNGGLNIADLGKLPHLHGKLSISQLQNVNDPFEVDRANIKMKEQIDELSLEWDLGSTFLDSQIQSVVLEKLRSSTNLKSLTIKGYGGISFPNWLGDSLFSNMVHLRISNCNDCLWLPPLGQLGNLKELIIEGMQSVETIGIEFYGSGGSSFQPFPSLQILHFENMEEWKEWDLIGGTTTTLPNLKTLSLRKCPKLIAENITEKFPFLTELELRECPLLVQSIPLFDHVFGQLMFPLNSLQQLTIDGFPSLMSFPNLQSFVIDELPSSLRKLSVGSVGGIVWNNEPTWEHLTSLLELRINADDMVNTLMGPLLPTSLVKLCICGLNDTSIDEKWLQHLTSLQNLEIINAPKLKSLPKKGFPSSLSVLSVTRCPLLEASLRKKREKEWRKIAHIPSIVINDELIT